MKNKGKKRSKAKIVFSVAITFITLISLAVYISFNFDFSSETKINSPKITNINGDPVQVNDADSVAVTYTVVNNYYNDPDKVIPEDDKPSDTDSDVGFATETHVRLADDEDRTWYKTVSAKVGDKVEFRIQYRNTSEEEQTGVAIKDVLFSNNLRYVDGSTILKNSNHPNGAYILNDALVENGIRIGNYGSNSNALLYFTAEVVDEDLVPGTNILSNWGQAGVGQITIQDHADVIVNIPKT